MNKNDIVNMIADDLEVTKKDASVILDSVLNQLQEGLAKEGSVQFAGFGSFNVSERAAREGINPKTGDKIQVAAVNVVGFRAGKALKDAVNPQRTAAAPAPKAPAKKVAKKVAKKK
jgi:DNA-binding protein HU-beta